MDELAWEKVLADLSQKVVQLTKVIVFLYTRSDGYASRREELHSACEDEVRQVSGAAATCVEAQRRHAAGAAVWQEHRLAAFERWHAEREEEARQALRGLRAKLDADHERARRSFTEADVVRTATVVELRRQAESLRLELGAAEGRARSDRQWLARQLACEVARERRGMDERFEEESAHLRAAHVVEVEELKATRGSSVAMLKEKHAQGRAALLEEMEAELVIAVKQQESGLEVELRSLEEQSERANEELGEGRAQCVAAKDECARHQRLLDEMSRELQDRKRQASALSSEMDKAHSRKVKAETETRGLRRQKAALDRALGNLGTAPQTERAITGLSEDVRSAQTRLQALRHELRQCQMFLEERRGTIADRERQAQALTHELAEERRRADELQRTLLRLEQSL